MARRAQSLPRFGVLAGSPLRCEECIAFAQVKPCGTQVTLCARYVCIGGKHQSSRFASPLTRLECVIGGNLRRPAAVFTPDVRGVCWSPGREVAGSLSRYSHVQGV